LVSFVELRHCHGSPRRLIPIVRCDEPKLAAVHPAFGIGHVERRLDADLHILAEFLGRTSKGCGNPKTDFPGGHPASSTACAALLPERFRDRRERRLLALRGCGRRGARGRYDPCGWNERPICRRVACGQRVRWSGDLLSL